MEIWLIAVIIMLGIMAAKIAEFYKLPRVVPLLLAGIFLNFIGISSSTIVGESLVPLFQLALALVLFHAGLTAKLDEFRDLWKSILSLATIQIVFFTVIAGILINVIVGLPFSVSLLLGVLLSPADPIVTLSILKAGDIKVKREISITAEGAAAFNDATAIVLCFDIILPIALGSTVSPLEIVLLFLWKLVGGFLCGLVIAFMMGKVLENVLEGRVISILVLSSAMLSYGLAETISASGAVASVTTGILVSNLRILGIKQIPRAPIIEVMENLLFLLEILAFIVLGSLINIDSLVTYAVPSVIVTLITVLIVWPVSVITSLLPTRSFNLKEMFCLSWIFTGAIVSAILASTVYSAGIAYADILLTLSFFTILLSVVIKGTTLTHFIKILGLEEMEDVLPKLAAKRDALRASLLRLVEEYTKGTINRDIYNALSSEIKDMIVEIENEMSEITERKYRLIEELNAKKLVAITQLEHLKKELEEGNLDREIYEELSEEIRNEILDIESQLSKLET
ncbi:MAG: cation:proton antiporter [Candidatus Asgardarchaeia archaeon]